MRVCLYATRANPWPAGSSQFNRVDRELPRVYFFPPSRLRRAEKHRALLYIIPFSWRAYIVKDTIKLRRESDVVYALLNPLIKIFKSETAEILQSCLYPAGRQDAKPYSSFVAKAAQRDGNNWEMNYTSDFSSVLDITKLRFRKYVYTQRAREK